MVISERIDKLLNRIPFLDERKSIQIRMDTNFMYSRSSRAPIQRPRALVWEAVESSKDLNHIKVSKRANEERESKQRMCICCLLILIILLLSSLYVAMLLVFRSRNCEIPTQLNIEETSTLDVQTTMNPPSPQNIHIENSKKISSDVYTSPGAHVTLNPSSTRKTTTEMVTEMSTKSNGGVPFFSHVHTTPYPISAQNFTIGSIGKRFVVLFMASGLNSTKNVYVTSENGVQSNISTSSRLNATLKTQIDRNVNIPSSQRIILPPELDLHSFEKEVKSVLIETSSDVFVISHDDGDSTVGSTTHIPLHKLSTEYVVISTEPGNGAKSQLAVSAIQDNTRISVTFKMRQNLPLVIEGNAFYDGYVFNFSLDRFQTYQIAHMTDLTGTSIESSVPIAAFSGNDCNTFGNMGACDHLFEQLPPIESADNAYIVPPNADERDTVIRMTAIDSLNITYTIGRVSKTLYLCKFDSFNITISSSEACYIRSDTPFFVTAFGLHSKNSSLGDPSMAIVTGINQYLDYYKIVVPSGYDHYYVSIMMRYSSKNFFCINGTVIKTNDIVFEENLSVGNATYNVRSIRVVEGELTASSVNGERFGLMFAGVTDYEAYGFSGNSMLP